VIAFGDSDFDSFWFGFVDFISTEAPVAVVRIASSPVLANLVANLL
jgi:bifunctional ADP-heptose synthase (sugar kinase/adenylyltransferase)